MTVGKLKTEILFINKSPSVGMCELFRLCESVRTMRL